MNDKVVGFLLLDDESLYVKIFFAAQAIKSNSKKPESLSLILSFFLSFLSNFPQQRKARASVPKR